VTTVTILASRIALVAIGALILWALWRSSHPRPAFVVQIEEGGPRTVRGVVTPAFLELLRDLLARHGVQSGTIRGLPQGGRIRLAFSDHFPASARQQILNWWAISGWNAGKVT
jgi:hypothetical protein